MRVVIIPARGGSKRLPRKNKGDINKLPMIAWPIKAALETNLFDCVTVSTDDLEIAEMESIQQMAEAKKNERAHEHSK